MKGMAYCGAVVRTSKILSLTVMAFLAASPQAFAKDESLDITKTRQRHVATTYATLPLSFEANIGQTSEQVKFLSRGQGYTLFLTRQAEAVLVLDAAAESVS